MAHNNNNVSTGMLGMLRGLFDGKFLSVTFFKKNAPYIVFGVFMLLMFISNKYTAQQYESEIRSLKAELVKANSDWVTASAEYNSMIRESEMKARVDTMHIDLTSPEQPPYNLNIK